MAISKSIIFVLFFFLFMAAIHLSWATNKASSFHCLENERSTLLSIKHGLANATMLSSWVGQDCCQWEGVGCDDFSGHVVELRLSGSDLSGQIPMSIGRLANLTVLSITSSRLSGRIPNSFGRLSNLKQLDLSSNQLNGIVPEILGQLSNLSELILSDNSFSGTVSELHFAKLIELETLDLGGNSLSLNITSGWVPPFQLENLLLGSCDVGTVFPAWLRTQASLLQLDMSNAGISESIPHWFVNFTSNLDLLDLSGNQIYGKVPGFKVTELYLSSNKFDGFSSDLEVTILDLSNNKISGIIIPEDIGMLSGMESLSLYNNTINGTIPSSLCKLQDLQFLDLSKNDLSGHLPRCLSELLNLVVLDLTSNNLTGTIPSSFSKLSSLETLHLSKNAFHGELPSSLQRCGNLSLLDLGDNFLSGDVPNWIGEKLLSLEILGLRSNKFNGSISPKLSFE